MPAEHSPIPDKDALLRELDARGHSARVRHTAELGRDHAGDPRLAGLVDACLRGDAYEGRLAVEIAQGARDLERLARATGHRSLTVRRRATFYLLRQPDAQASLRRLCLQGAPAQRRALMRGLLHHGHASVARELLSEVLASFGPRDATLVLAGADAETVARELPRLAHACAGSWKTLLLHHRPRVVAYLRDALAQAPERERLGVWLTHVALVDAMVEVATADLLALAREHVTSFPTGSLLLHVGALAKADSAGLLALLRAPAHHPTFVRIGPSRRLLNQLWRFDRTSLVELGSLLREAPQHLGPLLARVAPSRREAIFEAIFADEDTARREWPPALLDALPRARQRREAARVLGLEAVRSSPERVLMLTAYLAPADAREPLLRAGRAADATERGQALALLVACAGRAGELGLALEVVAQRLRNEQDPVRAVALQALARVPAEAFTAEHVPLLEAITQAVAQARDTSYLTRGAVQGIAFRLMRAHAADPDATLLRAALAMLRALVQQSDHLVLPDLRQGLPRGSAQAIVDALALELEAAGERERVALVLALATALGRRAFGVPRLARELERLVDVKPDHLASRAIMLLLADPAGRDARVQRLLDRDRSAIALLPVLLHLHRRRQEWLDPFLEPKPIRGRFMSGKTIHVLPVRDGFFRWLPRQQHAFAELLERAARDRGHTHFTRADMIAVRARLPITRIADFAPYLAGSEVPLVEAALGALPWLDAPAEALPVLLEHVDGDRARVAMYAVPRCARFVETAVLAGLLGELARDPARKITVRKEAIRLLGAYRSPASLSTLEALVEADALHKDVAMAIGHAARALADDPRALRVLERLAARGEPDIVRSLVEAVPSTLPTAARPRYAAMLLGLHLHPDDRTRRCVLERLAGWSSGQEPAVAAALAEHVVDLDERSAWDAAATGLVAVCSDGRATDVLVSAVARLVARSGLPAAPTPERDLPAEQRLRWIVERMLAGDPVRRHAHRARIDEVAAALEAREELWALGARLRVAATDLQAEDAAERLQSLAAAGPAEASRERIVAALAAEASAIAVPPARLLELAAALCGRGTRADHLALGLVCTSGERSQWPVAAAAALDALRRHPDLRLRVAARSIVVVAEVPG